MPALRGGDFQRRGPTHGSGAVQVDRGGVASKKFGQLLVVTELRGLPNEMDVGLGFGLGRLALCAVVGPGFGLAFPGTEAD